MSATDGKHTSLLNHGFGPGATLDMWSDFLRANGDVDAASTSDALAAYLDARGYTDGRLADRFHAYLSAMYPAMEAKSLTDLTAHWYAQGMPV